MKLMRLAVAAAKTRYKIDPTNPSKPTLVYRANRWNLTPCWGQEVPKFETGKKTFYVVGRTPIVEEIHGPFIKRVQDITRTITGEDNDLDPRLGTESIFGEPPAGSRSDDPQTRQEILEWVTRVYNTSDELDSEYNSKRGRYSRDHSLYYKYITSETYNRIQKEVMLREFNKAVEKAAKANPNTIPDYAEITKIIAARFDAATTTIRKVRSDKPENKQRELQELKNTLKPTKSGLPFDITEDPRYRTIQKQVMNARSSAALAYRRSVKQDQLIQPAQPAQPFSITDVFPLRYTGPSNGTYTQYEIINPLSYLPKPSAHALTPCYPTTCRATLLPLNYKRDTPNELDSVRVWRGRKSEPLSPTNVTIMSKLAYHMIEGTLTEKMKQYIADNPRIEKAFQEWKQDVGE